jgi:hypothetical protein
MPGWERVAATDFYIHPLAPIEAVAPETRSSGN